MKAFLATLLAVVLSTPLALADDWPGWMGPRRDNIWRETGLLQDFSGQKPKTVWRTPVAGGYAGPAVADGRVFVTDYVTQDDVKIANFDRKQSTGTERVLCLDQATGNVLWSHEYPVTYTISYPAGPRCTPIVDRDRVYTLGAEGNLFCFDVSTGEILWEKDFIKQYGTKAALWGWASHPLIYEDTLICVVGGEGSHSVAFNKRTGEEVWRALNAPEQGYSPPTLMQAAGVLQLILARPNAISSVDPDSGNEYWSVPYDATSGSVIMSPVRSGDMLYVGGYSNQNLLLKLTANPPGADVLWGNKAKHGISPINVQPFMDGEVLYGFDQDGRLYAIDLPTGDRIWDTTEPLGKRPVGSGTAFIVRQADRYWLFTENGDLIICKLSPEGYEEIDRTHVIEPTNVAFGRDVVWCAPAFADGKMFVRNDAECICVDLRAK